MKDQFNSLVHHDNRAILVAITSLVHLHQKVIKTHAIT